ncbi:MAG: hypothetical protein CHACPFDD_01195 [Phycisphaerae bacterium]|nr:hypothetical protein [Phycisphaerae bacterium]
MKHASALLTVWQNVPHVVIGMCHLQPLPGSPRHSGRAADVLDTALRDVEALTRGGVHGIMIENFGDTPFYPERAPACVVAHMTAIAARIRAATDLPIGVNVLRNDGRSALAVAHAAGAQFIRVNVLSHARVADQGVIQAIAHDLLRERAWLAAGDVRIMADVDAKESTPLGVPLPIEDEVDDAIHRGLADAVIISGANTGAAASLEKVRRARPAAGNTPLFIGSGIRPETVAEFAPFVDGFIVGTSLKRGGACDAPVDVERVRELMRRVTALA